MAEIEHFCDPSDKSHPKFQDISDTELVLYSACNQMDGRPAETLTVGAAVAKVSRIFPTHKLLPIGLSKCLIDTQTFMVIGKQY